MEEVGRNLSMLEIRSLMLETLVYEGTDISPVGSTFAKFKYQGTQADLFNLMESLAIKKGLIEEKIALSRRTWWSSAGILDPGETSNFTFDDLQNVYAQFHLFTSQGILAPGAVGERANLPFFHVTKYGLKCIEKEEVLPYDVDGYFAQVKEISGISEWTKFYIMEALRCYNANCMGASIIMLGLASERIILEKIESFIGYLSVNYEVEYLKVKEDLDKRRKISGKLECYEEHFERLKSRIQDIEFKDMLPLLDSVSTKTYRNFVRITRNELVHPTEVKMERIEVLMIFISYVKYCKVQYGLIDYFNRKSICA